MKKHSPRIAVIGCGAVTEARHLPVLAKLGIKPALLVDINLRRVQKLAETFHAAHITDDYRSHVGGFDAAIVAAPHHLHAPVCIDLLSRGIHVFVEKPMALTGSECDRMIAAAEGGKAVLAVGLMRRYLRNAQWVKAVLEAQLLGPIESFDFREGGIYDWSVASGFFFKKETAGGGVLMDTGAHTLDLLLWWLGDAASFEYWDDSYGGVEADCLLNLTLAGGAKGVVELSRTRELRNTAVIRGRRGQIEMGLGGKKYIDADPKKLLDYKDGTVSSDRELRQMFLSLFDMQIEDWLCAIETGEKPLVTGVEAARSVALIEACYKERRLLELPWVSPGRESNDHSARLRKAEVENEALSIGSSV